MTNAHDWMVMAKRSGAWMPLCRASSRETADRLADGVRRRESQLEVVVTATRPEVMAES